MAKINYIEPDGTVVTLEVGNGLSVMEGAVKNNLSGIEADCGGACSCATCHVYIDPKFLSKVAPPNSAEAALLDFVTDRRENSRLSCQIPVTDEIDGLVAQIPAIPTI